MTDASKAVITLTTRLGDTSRRSLPPTMWASLKRALTDASLPVESVFEREADWSGIAVDPELAARVDELLADSALIAVEIEQLSRRGIWALTIEDPGFPAKFDRLDDLAPPVLFGAGNSALLDEPSIGVVGSRDVVEEGAALAIEIARTAAERGLAVVSGGARGVDQLAMNGAFMAGGGTVGVLADALDKRIRSSEVLAALDTDRTCLVTQQHPSAGFTPGSAMARNKLVYALSTLTVVVATASGTGGTWSGATEALKHGYGRVAVWRGAGEGPGNEDLAGLGAVPFSDPDELWAIIENEPETAPTQLDMWATDTKSAAG